MNYRFTVEAKEDLREAVEYYEAQREGLGSEFAIEVGIGIARVVDAPLRWPELEPGVRKYRLDRFPYALIYLVPDARHVDIVAVFDLRSRPGGWRSRLP